MKKLLIATTNLGKWNEFKFYLRDYFHCVLPSELGTKSVPCVVENGRSYQENSLLKAEAFFKEFKIPVLSDDSGLEVEALQNGPGIHSARYGGEAISWEDRINILLGELQGVPLGKRGAQFKCVLCYYDHLKTPKFFEGEVKGFISVKPRGNFGFGYDPVFLIPSLSQTFGEIDQSVKGQFSHRTKALQNFTIWLKSGHKNPS